MRNLYNIYLKLKTGVFCGFTPFNFYFSEPLKEFFKIVLKSKAPILHTEEEVNTFINCLFSINSFNINKIDLSLLFRLFQNQIALSLDSLEDMINLIHKFHELDTLCTESRTDFALTAHVEAITNIQNSDDLKNCIFNIDNTISTFKKRSLHHNNSDTIFNSSSASNLLSDSDSESNIVKCEAAAPNAKNKRKPWLYSILLGAVIGAIAAAIVIATVASVGAVPATLTLMAAIGVAIGMTFGSTLLGGGIGALVNQFRSMWRASATRPGAAETKPVSRSASYKSVLSRFSFGKPRQEMYLPDPRSYRRLMLAHEEGQDNVPEVIQKLGSGMPDNAESTITSVGRILHN